MKAKPVIMLEPKDAMLLELHRTIQHLKKENLKLAQQVQVMGRPQSSSTQSDFGGAAAAAAASSSGRERQGAVFEDFENFPGGEPARASAGGAPLGPVPPREGRLGGPMLLGDEDRPKTRKGTRGGTGAGAGSLSGPIPYPPGAGQAARAGAGRGGAQRGAAGGRPGPILGAMDSPLSSSSTEPNLPRRASVFPGRRRYPLDQSKALGGHPLQSVSQAQWIPSLPLAVGGLTTSHTTSCATRWASTSATRRPGSCPRR